MITSYHAKYYAHELTAKKPAHLIDRLTYSLVEASVDLNPHQIEAALFVLRSPLSKGVILADEVGLGKTIEAGLLLCQYWAEHKRHLLIICPASIRRQWSIELEEKFRMPSLILENKTYQKMKKDGMDPLMFDGAIIMSLHFAARLKDELQRIDWALCVIDEAHKLRNVYKKDNKMGKAICAALQDKRKVNCSFAYRLVGFDTQDERDHWSMMSKQERKRLKLQPKIYKPSSDLGKKVLESAKSLETESTHLVFDYENYPHKITVLDKLRGKAGWVRAAELTTKSFEENTYLILAAIDDEGNQISDEVVRKLFKLEAKAESTYRRPPDGALLAGIVEGSFEEFLAGMDQHNNDFFSEEMDKLDKWAEDRRTGLKTTLKELDGQIKELKKQARNSGNLPDRLALQKKVRKLEGKRDEAWREYDDSAKMVEEKKDELIDMVEKRLKQQNSIEELFNISFEIH